MGQTPGGDTETPLGTGPGGSSLFQSFLQGIGSIQNAHWGLFCSRQFPRGRGRSSRTLGSRMSKWRESGAGLVLSMQPSVQVSSWELSVDETSSQ